MRYMYMFVFILLFNNMLMANSKTSIEVIEPRHHSLYEESYASIVVKVNDARVDKLEIVTDTHKSFLIDVNISKKEVYCKSVTLHFGQNGFLVRGYSKEKMIAKASSTIFYRSPLVKGFHFAPKRFKKTFFHSNENEKMCSKCHDMHDNTVKGVAFIDVSESNCYDCHKLITSQKYAHAPTLNWLCTQCHNGQVGKGNKKDFGKSKYLTPIPVVDGCFACHKKEDKNWWIKKYQHDPVSEGKCNKCHNLHSSPFKNFTRKSHWDLCLSCHEGKLNRAEFEYENSNLSKDEVDKFICTKCHHQHTSNRRYFLKKGVKDDKLACEKLNIEQKGEK